VKDLSLKLYEWTGERWIITFSKTKGQISIKEKQNNKKKELVEEAKASVLYKTVLEKFSDANLINVVQKDKEK
jgi:DNA polymerase-3 subunit gamma/tau